MSPPSRRRDRERQAPTAGTAPASRGPLFQGAVDKQNDRVNVKWFRDVVVRAALDRVDGGLHVPDSGRQHDNNGSAIGRSPFLSGSYPSGHCL